MLIDAITLFFYKRPVYKRHEPGICQNFKDKLFSSMLTHSGAWFQPAKFVEEMAYILINIFDFDDA